MNLSGVFRGSDALAAGVLTRNMLAGPGYRKLFRDVYAPAELPVDLKLRSLGAHALVAPRGVLSGYSAAELLGASCGPVDAPAEVICPNPRRPQPGLIVRRARLHPTEIVERAGIRMTAPLRTAFDLACTLELTEAVVAVDALAHRRFDPAELRTLRCHHLGAPGSRALERVLELADARAESPMETRIRVPLVLAGLPPHVQYPVRVGTRGFRLDMGYPAARVGVEYDGRHHLTPEQARRDLEREANLAGAGWRIIRFDAATVLHRPWMVVERTRAELAARIRAVS